MLDAVSPEFRFAVSCLIDEGFSSVETLSDSLVGERGGDMGWASSLDAIGSETVDIWSKIKERERKKKKRKKRKR
jgi:hypothetical protein